MTVPFLTVFITAMELSGTQRLLLLLPLCLSIAVVYKTTRCEDLREVPREAAVLWTTLVLGMSAVGVALWLTFRALV